MEQEARVVALSDAIATQTAKDKNETLNAIAGQGWELVTADFVFVPTREQSREKLLRTGQDVAVAGSVVGYYVFRRSEKSQG